MKTKKFYNTPSLKVRQLNPSNILAGSNDKPENVDLTLDPEIEEDGYAD